MREDWELFQYDHEQGSTYVRRLAVPGGWLYQVSFAGPPDSNNFQAPVFVPTPINVERRAADLTDDEREALRWLREHGDVPTGRSVECNDPQCGDSTWDHDCNAGWEEIPEANRALAVLDKLLAKETP